MSAREVSRTVLRQGRPLQASEDMRLGDIWNSAEWGLGNPDLLAHELNTRPLSVSDRAALLSDGTTPDRPKGVPTNVR